MGILLSPQEPAHQRRAAQPAGRADNGSGQHVRGIMHRQIQPGAGNDHRQRQRRPAQAAAPVPQGRNAGHGGRRMPRRERSVRGRGDEQLHGPQGKGPRPVHQRLDQQVAENQVKNQRAGHAKPRAPGAAAAQQHQCQHNPDDARVAQMGDAGEKRIQPGSAPARDDIQQGQIPRRNGIQHMPGLPSGLCCPVFQKSFRFAPRRNPGRPGPRLWPQLCRLWGRRPWE